MTLHRYRSYRMVFGKILVVLFCILIPALLLIGKWDAFFAGSSAARSIGDLLGLLVLSIGLLFNIVLGVTMLNFFPPDIMIHDGGLSIKFYFGWLFVPWEDVISVKRLPPLAIRRTHYLVRVKKLTVVHRLIGLFRWGSLRPGFLISSGIDGYQELLRVIREHIGETQESE